MSDLGVRSWIRSDLNRGRAGHEPAALDRWTKGSELEPAARIELAASRLQGARSSELSYAGGWKRERESNPIISWVRARRPADWTIPP